MDENLVEIFEFWYPVKMASQCHIMTCWHNNSYVNKWTHNVALWTHMLTFKIIFYTISSYLSKYETLRIVKPYVDIENHIAQY